MNMEENKNVKLYNNEASTPLDSNSSILDFRSPEKERTEKIKEMKLFNLKSTKCKKSQIQLKIKVNSVDNRPSASKQVQEKISGDTHFLTESDMSYKQENKSTNLPSNTKIAYVCPLCFKNLKDNDSRILHMKKCATKNKVPLKKLLQAIELQERQTAERVSLGLPSAPVLQNKKQSSIHRTAINEDPQLQLALALSKSLYEVEEIKTSSETDQSFTLTNTSNQVENITSRLPKRKKQSIISILQIRSQEERDRLLTENIAELLIDNEALLEKQQQAINKNKSTSRNSLRSHVLRKVVNFDNKLWNTATLQSSCKSDFYVPDLSSYIIPSESKLSFMENINKLNIVCQSQCKDSLATKSNSYLNKEESSSTLHNVDVKLIANMKEKNIKQSPVRTMIADWRNALNNSSSSDIIIFTNRDKHIWVHKLVFYVRCPNILLDISPNENLTYSVKEKICWDDTEYNIALAFLEFIYCGIIEKYSISSNESVAISSLGRLARRYKVKELFSYLRHEHNFYDKISKNQILEMDGQGMQEVCRSNDEKDKLGLTSEKDITTVKYNNKGTFDLTAMEISHDQLLKPNLSPEKYTMHDLLTDRGCVSPDIFDDIDNTTLNYADNIQFINSEEVNLENVTANQLSSPSPTNKSRSSINECMLDKSIVVSPKMNQAKQDSNAVVDKVQQKGNLTLFIEEVQKENAKSDFDIDSEIDSPAKPFFQHNRNPFRKVEINESSTIFDKLDNSELPPTKTRKKVSRLSKFESDMQIHAIQNPQLYNLTLNDNHDDDHDCTDLSVPVKDIEISDTCSDESTEVEQSVQKNNVSIASYSSSEMDPDDPDISMYTKYKKKHTDNSIAVYRSALKTHTNNMIKVETDKKENDELITSDHISNFSTVTKRTYSNIDDSRNVNVNVLSPSDVNMDESISIIRMENNISNPSFAKEFINETEICNTLINNTSRSTESFKRQKTGNWSNDKLIVSHDDISLKIQTAGDRSFNDDHSNILNLPSPILHNTEERHSSLFKSPLDSDPIIISSSPDIDMNSTDDDNTSKHSQHVLNSETQEFSDELQNIFLSERNFSNVNIENEIGGVTLKSSTFQMSINNKKLRKRSRSEGSLHVNYSVKENYEICGFNNIFLRQCSKPNNCISNVKNRLFTINESYDILPPNYDAMDTPELHKEMKKYGLKVQNRKRAIKLLTHIYNELHPTITSCEIVDASIEKVYDDEEPQKKRQKTNENLSNKYNNIEYECNLSPHKNLSPKHYLQETRITAEADVIALNDCVSINEAFFKLISFNRDLHNQILRYEPLNIELIHCMLKTGGFKCKINNLMDFLDEQCITFYLPENKTKTRTRKVHS